MQRNIIEACDLPFGLRVRIVLVNDIWEVYEVLWHGDVEITPVIRIRPGKMDRQFSCAMDVVTYGVYKKPVKNISMKVDKCSSIR